MRIHLTNPYFTQRNNRTDPALTCNVTAMVTALAASGIEFPVPPGQQPEDFLSFLLDSKESRLKASREYPLLQNRHPREIHRMLAWAVNDRLVGRKVVQFSTQADLRILLWRLAVQRSACVVTGKFTAYGHMVALVGFETTQEEVTDLADPRFLDLDRVSKVIIDDPWGDWRTAYKDPNGNDIELSLGTFNTLTRDYGNPGKKWAHIIARNGNFLEGVWGN